MSQFEALTITALGISVVFIGLLLCIAFIEVFSRIAKGSTWGEHGHGAGHQAAPAAVPDVEPPQLPPAEPVDGEVLAVIATVIEVERKLYLNRSGRLTIRRPAVVSGV
jgi:Na+-transporting methylmalonyl-CoA/oxaloacetate decarboxylase gamma subunit